MLNNLCLQGFIESEKTTRKHQSSDSLSDFTFSAAVDLAETWTSRDITKIALETELVGTVAGTVHNDAVFRALRVATDASPSCAMKQILIKNRT